MDKIGYERILKGNEINLPAGRYPFRKIEKMSMYKDFSGNELDINVPGNKPNESSVEHPVSSAETELRPLFARPDKVLQEDYSSGTECECLVSLGGLPVKIACMLVNRKYATKVTTFPATETKVSGHVDKPQAIVMNYKPKRKHRHTY